MTVIQPAHATPARVVELEIEGGAASPDGPGESPAPASASSLRASLDDTQTQPEPCGEMPLEVRVEALLMTTDRPISEGRLGEVLGLSGKGVNKRVAGAIEALNQHYEQTGRAFRAHRLAGGWQLLTLPAFGPLLHRMHEQRELTRLSQPALETLAIVAYRQPIMRAEIEAIRGVASGEVLRSLMERRLVKIVGRAEELGRPMLYGTTSEFLKVFGMANMDDLPQIKGLNMPNAPRPTVVATNEPTMAPPTDSNAVEPTDQGEADTRLADSA